ncbi:MAG: biopolymer transporter ExbD [Bacteroidetes bacterium]|nr:biopolymer transporter ExbD [Bacteroidota bacterium]
MPKIKAPVRTPHIDMTPMVDLFSVLLIFLLLTASFRPSEATVITSPNSVSEKQAPDKDIMTIIINKDGTIFFNIDNGKDSAKHTRVDVLTQMGKQYNITFTPKELNDFGHWASFGMPIADFKKWLNAKDSKEKDKLQTGIPIDSVDNQPSQLFFWVRFSRLANPYAEVAIKGDGEANYKKVKMVMDLLQESKVNKFNLVTNLEKQEVTLKDLPK